MRDEVVGDRYPDRQRGRGGGSGRVYYEERRGGGSAYQERGMRDDLGERRVSRRQRRGEIEDYQNEYRGEKVVEAYEPPMRRPSRRQSAHERYSYDEPKSTTSGRYRESRRPYDEDEYERRYPPSSSYAPPVRSRRQSLDDRRYSEPPDDYSDRRARRQREREREREYANDY